MNTFTYDDGGRAAAGFPKHRAGDCVARSVAIASGQPYLAVHAALAAGNAGQRKSKGASRHTGKATADHGINCNFKWFKDYMCGLGFDWFPTMGIGTGCRVHLKPSELPPGRLVVAVSKHSVAVVDGVVRDTYDCTRGGTRCVYGYWKQVRPPTLNLNAKAAELAEVVAKHCAAKRKAAAAALWPPGSVARLRDSRGFGNVIESVEDNRATDGSVWLDLKPNLAVDGGHAVHEWSRTEAARQLLRVAACHCGDCDPEGRV